jgi:DNA gyrase/topoisomerase IV subunit A
METKNFGNIEKDSLELVLEEFTEEQKAMKNIINEQTNTIDTFKKKIEDFEKKLDNLKVTSPPLNTTPFREIISQGNNEIKKIIAEQPKNVVQEKRFLLFPEHNAREYYSVVLRWVLYIIIATYGYFLLKHI